MKLSWTLFIYLCIQNSKCVSPMCPALHEAKGIKDTVPAPGGTSGKEYACNTRDSRDVGLISGSGRSPGEGNGYPLQCFFLENSMDTGAWWATIHGVAKNRTWLKQLNVEHPPRLREFKLAGVPALATFIIFSPSLSWGFGMYLIESRWLSLFLPPYIAMIQFHFPKLTSFFVSVSIFSPSNSKLQMQPTHLSGFFFALMLSTKQGAAKGPFPEP